ncbi:T9SS type A sorting domain-containing protein [Hymenobacter lutimineralis]|uniref:T9SS type A sorting domain-containing protein n=1 Tax=Hymenobacter lutimineralis TaxID=2606448 RepID=A0A5D6V748_9BACT|nr:MULTISPECIES: RICIN domain-containing protein [Hymenobacter]QIX62863.1 T9SS type A sorting domain-containing protein [Hymenobacter sp. BT18]TYZ10982.1 T9SS type A sorting domain-containing protein [Hymenobacter lutimineralis]
MKNTLRLPNLIAALLLVLLTAPALWAQTPGIVSGGVYKFTHKGVTPAVCLDVDNNLATPGTRIHQWLDNGNDAQRFVVTLQTDGSYKLMHLNTDQFVQPVGGATEHGTRIEQNNSTDADYQRWTLQDMGEGYYKVTLKGTNQCLEVAGNSPDPGADVQLWDDNGNDAQRWLIERMDATTGNKRAAGPAFSLTASPNPFSQQLRVEVQGLANGPARISLCDMLGRSVYSEAVELRRGPNTLPVRTSAPAGLYVLRVQQGASVQQLTLVQR